MKRILFSIILCSVAMVATAQDTDFKGLGKTQVEFNPSISAYVSESIDFGFKAELALRKDRIRGGLYGECFLTNYNSIAVQTESFSTVTEINRDLNVYQVGLFAEYSPFNFNAVNPYVFGQGGILFWDSEKAYALSFGLGSEFLIPISNKYLKPFIQLGYQSMLKPKVSFIPDGLRLEIGIRIPF